MALKVYNLSDLLREFLDNPSGLVPLFTRKSSNTRNKIFYHECALLPGICEVFLSSHESEKSAALSAQKHLERHLLNLRNAPGGSSHLSFVPVQIRQNLQLVYSSPKSSQEKPQNPEKFEFQNCALKRLDDCQDSNVYKESNKFYIKISAPQNEKIEIILDFDTQKATFLEFENQPGISFTVTENGYINCLETVAYAYAYSTPKTQKRRNVWKCQENFDEIEKMFEIQDNLQEIFGIFYKTKNRCHDYCSLPVKIGPNAYMENELHLAFYVFNQWKWNRSNSSLFEVLRENAEMAAKAERKMEKCDKNLKVENEVFMGGKVLIAREYICTVSHSKSVPYLSISLPTPQSISIGQLSIAPKPASIPSVAEIIERIDEDWEEQKKRLIALEALQQLKNSGRPPPIKKTKIIEPKAIEMEIKKRENRLTCRVCNSKFTARSSLEDHYRSHAGIKQFECTVCHHKFTRRHSLNYHMLCHSGEIKYTCLWCEKLFRHPGHFKDHLRIHQSKPFVCPDCGVEFTNRTTLRRHAKCSHGKGKKSPKVSEESAASESSPVQHNGDVAHNVIVEQQTDSHVVSNPVPHKSVPTNRRGGLVFPVMKFETLKAEDREVTVTLEDTRVVKATITGEEPLTTNLDKFNIVLLPPMQ